MRKKGARWKQKRKVTYKFQGKKSSWGKGEDWGFAIGGKTRCVLSCTTKGTLTSEGAKKNEQGGAVEGGKKRKSNEAHKETGTQYLQDLNCNFRLWGTSEAEKKKRHGPDPISEQEKRGGAEIRTRGGTQTAVSHPREKKLYADRNARV